VCDGQPAACEHRSYRWRHRRRSRAHPDPSTSGAAADRGDAVRSTGPYDSATSSRAPVTRVPCTFVVLPLDGREDCPRGNSTGPSRWERTRGFGDNAAAAGRGVVAAKQVRCRLAVCVPGPHQQSARSTVPPPPPPPLTDTRAAWNGRKLFRFQRRRRGAVFYYIIYFHHIRVASDIVNDMRLASWNSWKRLYYYVFETSTSVGLEIVTIFLIHE